MLSLGMDCALALLTARRRRGFMSGSGAPILAATVISRESLENRLERFLSCAPLRCMMFLNLEWPAMASVRSLPEVAGSKGRISRMTGQVTTLQRAGAWRRFGAFLLRPELPERATGMRLAALPVLARLFALDLLLMTGLIVVAAMALALGI